jgi:hypothetical protein
VMWLFIIILAFLFGGHWGWGAAVAWIVGCLICLHIRNLYVRRYM